MKMRLSSKWTAVGWIIFFMLCTFCASDESVCMDELARATVSSVAVFEGRLEAPEGATSSLYTSDPLNATFAFRRAYKGNFRQITRAVPRLQIVVSVGSFQTSEVNTAASCGTQNLIPSRLYVVFLDQFPGVRSVQLQSSSVYLSSSAFPVLSSRRVLQQVRLYRCKKCGRLRAKVVPLKRSLHEGRTLSLTCRVSGRPAEQFDWLKDEQPLLPDGRIQISTLRKGSRLVIRRITRDDSGVYGCRVRNAVTVTNLATATVTIEGENALEMVPGVETVPDVGPHQVLCPSQDFCLNGGTCYMLRTLGRKFCTCVDGFVGRRCSRHSYGSNRDLSQQFRWWSDDSNKNFVISAVAVGTLLLACVLILVFCFARSYCNGKRRRRVARSDSDYRPPSLPDGHAVNVVNLNAAINRRSAAYAINLVASDLSPSTDDSHQIVAPDRRPNDFVDVPVVRRPHRRTSGSSSAVNSGGGGRGSAQVRLSMISAASSRGRLPTLPDAPTDPEVEVRSSHQLTGREPPRSASETNPLEHIELSQVDFAARCTNPVEETASPRASQCSHTESLICGVVGSDDTTVVPPAETAMSPAPPSVDNQSSTSTAAGRQLPPNDDESEISDPYDDDGNFGGDDLEVNVESEADMLAVEMSGDELDRGGIATSHDFSELSSQVTTDRGSSDDDDDDITSDDPYVRQRLLGFLNGRFGDADRGGDSDAELSWDESADMPSFAAPGEPPSTSQLPSSAFTKR